MDMATIFDILNFVSKPLKFDSFKWAREVFLQDLSVNKSEIHL